MGAEDKESAATVIKAESLKQKAKSWRAQSRKLNA
jgi:hypothetical protein